MADYIIVGQGLAGSCLALHLLMRNRSIIVMDNTYSQAASRVAAGLYNPITGKTPSLTWMAAELFPFLHSFYRMAEQITRAAFLHPMPVYRPFISAAERHEWTIKTELPAFRPFLKNVYPAAVYTDEVNNPFGGLELIQSGYIDTGLFLKAVRQLICEQGVFVETDFDERNLQVEQDRITYLNHSAARIVFCTGVHPIQLFNFLPVQKLKGEILLLDSEHKPKYIYNRGVYVVPGVWKAGATYNRHDTEEGITLPAKTELVENLQKLIRFPYQLKGQDFGFRPTTPDRRPLLGSHPHFRNVYYFNGLGTKGVTLAPYFAMQLADFMEKGEPVNQQVDLKRYLIR